MDSKLKKIVDSYMQNVAGIGDHCERCLMTERWGGSVVLMVVDASFTSIGLNYFTAVVPKVEEFERKFVVKGKIKNLRELAEIGLNLSSLTNKKDITNKKDNKKDLIKDLIKIWKNKRSWNVAIEVAKYLSSVDENDKEALRKWAKNVDLKNWKKEPIGRIKGVGINTFQYLRMMGGVDTVMPDKIVKRVINEILEKAGEKPVNDDLNFVEKVREIGLKCNYRPIELCWMTWMIQPEGKIMRMKKYSKILPKI